MQEIKKGDGVYEKGDPLGVEDGECEHGADQRTCELCKYDGDWPGPGGE